MLTITARDLQYRVRRYLIGALVAGLVFGIAFIFDGVKRAVHGEATAIVEVFGADAWLVADGASGPFTTTAVIPAATSEEVAAIPGVERADPVVVSRATLDLDSEIDVNLVGFVPGGLGTPPIAEGRPVQGPGEVVVGAGVDADVGDTLEVAETQLRVVGRADGLRFFFGTPSVFVALDDVQDLMFEGAPLALTIPIVGRPQSPPPGLTSRTNAEAEADLRRPTQRGSDTIEFVSLLLWIITIGIIGSVIYLAAVERTRDFAVLGAVGVPTRQVVGGLMIQALALSLVSAALAVPIAYLVSLGLPFPAEIGAAAVIQLLVVAAIVGLVASLAGVRKAVSTDPALAFGGA
jgi:putative ABC transport system permease protein